MSLTFRQVRAVLLAVGAFNPWPAEARAADWSTSGGLTAIVQSARDGDVDSEVSGSVDLFVERTTASGTWLLYIEGSTTPDASGISSIYPTANADAGSVLNRDGDGGLQVSEFHYTYNFGDAHHLMIGLVNPSAWLDRSRITNDENHFFINGSFKNNSTIEFPNAVASTSCNWMASHWTWSRRV